MLYLGVKVQDIVINAPLLFNQILIQGLPLCLFIVFVLKKDLPRPPAFFKPLKARDFVYILQGLAGLGLSLIIFISIDTLKPSRNSLLSYDNSIITHGLLIIFTLLSAIQEEGFFRGYIPLKLLQIGENSSLKTGFFQAFLFAFSHWHQGIAGMIQAFFAGLVLFYIMLKTESLYLPILAHAFFNLCMWFLILR